MTPFQLSDRAPDRRILMCAILLFVVCLHGFFLTGSEPFFNGDETRHVMTGVFFRDLYLDHPVHNLRQYATDYYLQYPALGIGVWPPLFHGIEGLAMLVFGPSIAVAKLLILVFSALAALYVFRLVEYTHDRVRAAAAALLFAVAPLIVIFSRQVMLEMPALAFILVSLFHWIRYLDRGSSADVWWAAGAATAAALIRFDAAFLILALLLLINTRARLAKVLRPVVAIVCVCALAVSVPVYWFVSREVGSVHLRSMSGGLSLFRALGYYPASLPRQIGWIVLLFAVCGLVSFFRKPRAMWPYLVLILVVYLVFTPIGEREPRHAIFWIPAWSVLAVEGIDLLSRGSRRVWGGVAAVAVLGTLLISLSEPRSYVRGYAEAARYVVDHLGTSEICFFDGRLDGDFIYQLRLDDPARRLWVLRGDKLLYSVLSGDPSAGYAEYAHSDGDILDTLYKYGPGLIIIESKPIESKETESKTIESKTASPDYAVAKRLRAVLQGHPERFNLVAEFPVETNLDGFGVQKIQVFQNLARDPAAPKRLEMQMMMLGHPVSTGLP